MKSRGILVIGTDTGVGKTFVSVKILQALRKRGVRVSAMKPFESGQASPADSEQLWKATGGSAKVPSFLCPFRFAKPLAPAQAGRLEGVRVSLTDLDQAFEQALGAGDFLVVEGCGGLLVPLLPENPRFTVEDLALRFRLPVLIVARAGLGTLNHTLLTLFRCQSVTLPVLGVILNQGSAVNPHDLSVESNSELLREVSGFSVWGPLPYCREISDDGNIKMQRILEDLLESL